MLGGDGLATKQVNSFTGLACALKPAVTPVPIKLNNRKHPQWSPDSKCWFWPPFRTPPPHPFVLWRLFGVGRGQSLWTRSIVGLLVHRLTLCICTSGRCACAMGVLQPDPGDRRRFEVLSRVPAPHCPSPFLGSAGAYTLCYTTGDRWVALEQPIVVRGALGFELLHSGNEEPVAVGDDPSSNVVQLTLEPLDLRCRPVAPQTRVEEHLIPDTQARSLAFCFFTRVLTLCLDLRNLPNIFHRRPIADPPPKSVRPYAMGERGLWLPRPADPPPPRRTPLHPFFPAPPPPVPPPPTRKHMHLGGTYSGTKTECYAQPSVRIAAHWTQRSGGPAHVCPPDRSIRPPDGSTEASTDGRGTADRPEGGPANGAVGRAVGPAVWRTGGFEKGQESTAGRFMNDRPFDSLISARPPPAWPSVCPPVGPPADRRGPNILS